MMMPAGIEVTSVVGSKERHKSKVRAKAREKEWSFSMLLPRRAFLGALAVNVKAQPRNPRRTMYIGNVRNAITSRLKRATGRGSWNMVGVGAAGRGDLPLFCFVAAMHLSHTPRFGCVRFWLLAAR